MNKKLIYIVTRLAPGGTLENILALSEAVSAEYELLLVLGERTTDRARVDEAAKRCGFRVAYVQSLVREMDPVLDTIAFFKIFSLIRREKPFILHTHTSKAGFLGRLAGYLAGARRIVHTPHGHVFYGYFGEFKTGMIIRLERLAARVTRKMIVFTHSEMHDHLDRGIGNRAKYVVIPNGIDVRKYSKTYDGVKMRKKLGISPGDFVFGIIGRLAPVKGHTYFLKAFALASVKRRGVAALFAGDGELEKTLKNEAEDLGISGSVKFLGNRDDIPEVLSACDAVVLPSLNEGFGIAAAEASASGKPVIASKVGGIPDVVINGRTGIIVRPSDPAGLLKAMLRLFDAPKEAERMGSAGRKFIGERFSAKEMAERIKEVYVSISDK